MQDSDNKAELADAMNAGDAGGASDASDASSAGNASDTSDTGDAGDLSSASDHDHDHDHATELADSEIIGELSEEDPIERAVFIALDEASSKLEEQGDFEPFIIIVQGDDLHIEELDGDEEDEIVAFARMTALQMQASSEAYILAYDGFVDLDDGRSDAIIVEYARTGEQQADVLAWLYYTHDDHIHFQDPLYNLGTYPSLYDVQKTSDDDEPNA
jgi:hypothetical protein